MSPPHLLRKLSRLAVIAFVLTVSQKASYSQTATVTNSAAPNANVSTNTSGGTNINQQLNNVYDTSFGFGPGIICRTPQIILNGTAGSTNSLINSYPLNTGNTQSAGSYSGTFGFAIPIGSSAIADCNKYAAQIAKDRQISSELSLIRACAQLEKERIVIDPVKYPLLASCISQLPKFGTNPNSTIPVPTSKSVAQPKSNSPVYQLKRFDP